MEQESWTKTAKEKDKEVNDSIPTKGPGMHYCSSIDFFLKKLENSKQVIDQQKKEIVELQKQLEVEADRRENMQMEILIVKGDLNLERNQRILSEEKLHQLTETIMKNRKSVHRDSTPISTGAISKSPKRFISAHSSKSTNKPLSSHSSSSTPLNPRISKENRDANAVMKVKCTNTIPTEAVPPSTSPVDDALFPISPSLKKQKLDVSPPNPDYSSCRPRRTATAHKVNNTNNPATRRSIRTRSSTGGSKQQEEVEEIVQVSLSAPSLTQPSPKKKTEQTKLKSNQNNYHHHATIMQSVNSPDEDLPISQIDTDNETCELLLSPSSTYSSDTSKYTQSPTRLVIPIANKSLTPAATTFIDVRQQVAMVKDSGNKSSKILNSIKVNATTNENEVKNDFFKLNEFPCSCGMQFKTLQDLQIHKSRKSPGKQFKCFLCPAVYVKRSDLDKHIHNMH